MSVLDDPGSFTITNLDTGVVDFSQTASGTSIPLTLQPGQSLSHSVTWTPGGSPPPSGTFSAYYENAELGESTGFVITPPGGVVDPIRPVLPPPSYVPPLTPPVVAATLSTPRAAIHLGQPDALALTLTNESSQSVKVAPTTVPNSLTIDRGSQVVWYSTGLTLRGHKTIAAGKSARLLGMWSGKANQRGEKRLAPGTYTAWVNYDGYAASETFQIKR